VRCACPLGRRCGRCAGPARPGLPDSTRQRVAAVIDAEDLDRLIAATEDLADIEAAQPSRNEMADGQAPIPWEQVKADLGLV
jgi:hypothetical protein